MPRIGERVNRTGREVRRLVLRRTRYLVFYELRNDELIVLRVWHSARRPGTHGVR
ncbi:MAG: type II toxin-antitoxin system RelE/ParE family toxin [Archangium sp.]|nr:type II toxin-antitoxin system RelE/ParE family toxin [Archangium sp.]